MKKVLFVFSLFFIFCLSLFAQNIFKVTPEGDILIQYKGSLKDISELFVPTGTIEAFGGVAAPQGWLVCDGRSLKQADYLELYNIIGTNFGDGSTDGDGNAAAGDFNLPDLRGQFLRGLDSGAGTDPNAVARTANNSGGNTGNAVGSEQEDAFASHNHNNAGYQYLLKIDGTRTQQTHDNSGGEPNLRTVGAIQTTGGIETRPKNVAVQFIIKY